MLYFLRLTVFGKKRIARLVFRIIAMQVFDFRNSIIVIKLFLVMILNLYLSSA